MIKFNPYNFMFKSGNFSKSDSFEDLSQYINGFDVFNSKLLRELNNPSVTKVSYLITRYEYRPDLIAKDIYGSTSYCSILMAQCRISLDGYTRGNVLRVIPKDDLDKIILNI